MLHFNKQHGKVIIDPINELMNLVREVQEKYDPDIAIRVLTYIHVASRLDPAAPFFSADEKEVRDLAIRNIFTETERETYKHEDFEDWKKLYEKEYETADVRVVKIFNDKIDQIREMIKDTTPVIVEYSTSSGSKGFASNTAIITKAMNDMDSLMDAKEKLEARIRKQSAKAGKIHGGKTPTRLEAKHMKASR